ncbi:MAG: sn-glycerol-3-phosphate ABC transporter ATP-binding protein UgpC [Rhodospirillaceae bacterium]|nr:sn-glycerol-3-phosphate ABC transporter ATP-binding protein UgpC [Rhodospirillaceae bacterium]
MAGVKLRGVHKRFGKVHAVRGVDIEIPDRAFTVLVGPSGCGKSTLLRMIAGLEELTEGTVEIEGAVVNDVRPKDRDVAMVFQNYALYPHMSVFENVAFGLRMRNAPNAEIRPRVERAAAMLGIADLLDRQPRQLSGGQRQRVAMGRALVRDAKLYLFDEPLSNLDAQLRDEMRTEIKRLHQEMQRTMIYVTHDQVEAMTLADRIVLLREGEIEQEGPPLELYERPQTRFVAGFIGSPAMNFAPAQIEAADGTVAVRAGDDAFALPPERAARHAGDGGRTVLLGIRPEHMYRAEGEVPRPDCARLKTTVEIVEPMGANTLVNFHLGETSMLVRLDGSAAEQPGTSLALDVDMSRAVLVDPESERVI